MIMFSTCFYKIGRANSPIHTTYFSNIQFYFKLGEKQISFEV